MQAVLDWFTGAGEFLKWVVGVGAAVGAIWGFLGKPIKAMRGEMSTVQGITDMLMGDRLAQAHDHWMQKGYCPPLDKHRLVAMHAAYEKRGLNHLTKTYEQDLLTLPDKPPKGGERG